MRRERVGGTFDNEEEDENEPWHKFPLATTHR